MRFSFRALACLVVLMALGSFTASAQSPGDKATDPVALIVGVPGAFDNTGASAQTDEVSPGPGSAGPGGSCNQQDGWCAFETGVQNSVWFTFEAPPSGCVNIATDNTFDLQLAVWDVADSSKFSTFVELAANDDSGPLFSPFIENLSCLDPGQTYWVQLDGFLGTKASGNLIVTQCAGDPLTVDAGECQNRLINDGDDVNDVNYLVPTIEGGVAPSTCSWSSNSADPYSILLQSGCTLAVQPDTSTTYCVDVTDTTGCTVNDCVTVQVVDVVCHKNEKVEICHVPPGNPDNPQQLCISPDAVPSHLAEHEGDVIGPCECMATNPPLDCVDLTVNLTTDLFGDETSWELIDRGEGIVLDSRTAGSLDSSKAYSDTFCGNPSHCYEFTIHDVFGDGICCDSGLGSYEVIFDGVTQSGGDFESTETVFVGNCPGEL